MISPRTAGAQEHTANAAPVPEALRALASVEHLPKKGDSGPVSWSTGAYVYDGAGNIAVIGTRVFVYDEENRLRQYLPGGLLTTQVYDYDRYGNQVSNTIQGAIGVDLTTNHLTGSVIGYDDAGNLVQWTPSRSPSAVHYAYDGFSMLQEVSVAGVLKGRYIYTADDERVRIDTPAASLTHWTVRAFDNQELRDVELQGTTWSLFRDFIHRDSKLLATVTPVRVENDSLDHLGTPRLVTDQTGVKIGYHEYYPFGVEATPAGTLDEGNPRRFTGHERDLDPQGGDQGLDYMHARYYDRFIGRFLSVDRSRNWAKAMELPQAWNRYPYSRDNPMRLVDLDGNDDKDFRILTVNVNVVYSNEDINGESLRQVTEQGIAYSRAFFTAAGIKLSVHRYEGAINMSAGLANMSGPVKTGSGDVNLKDFVKSQPNALNVVVTGDFAITGLTKGPGGPTVIGNSSDKMVFDDEMGHALGNVTAVHDFLGISNTLTDMRMDLQETFVENGLRMDDWFVETFRDTADQVNNQPPPL
jgi:RHS repeat-associated protein